MAKLVWDQQSERHFETGVKKCVLYPYASNAYSAGVAWNGITSISENPSGGEATALYADDIKYLNLYSAEEFGCTIEAYTYPEEFEACDGSKEIVADSGVIIGQQERSMFGLCYRTAIGNDVDGSDHGYKIHLIYGCKASPSQRQYSTINDSPEAITFSWEVTTTPVDVTNFKPTAHLVIDSTRVAGNKLTQLENKLYGTDGTGSTGTNPTLPTPNEVITILNTTSTQQTPAE